MRHRSLVAQATLSMKLLHIQHKAYCAIVPRARASHFISLASPVAAYRLQQLQPMGLVFAAHRPSCSLACGFFPDQGLNPCSLHWQVDAHPPHHRDIPSISCLWLLLCSSGRAEQLWQRPYGLQTESIYPPAQRGLPTLVIPTHYARKRTPIQVLFPLCFVNIKSYHIPCAVFFSVYNTAVQ